MSDTNTPNPVTLDDIYERFLTGKYTLVELEDYSRGKFCMTTISKDLSKRLGKNRKRIKLRTA